MKIKIALAVLLLASTSLVSAMAHDRSMSRILQLLKHLTEAPLAITYGQAPGIRLDPDVVIGKHKHLFNFICSKIIGASN